MVKRCSRRNATMASRILADQPRAPDRRRVLARASEQLGHLLADRGTTLDNGAFAQVPPGRSQNGQRIDDRHGGRSGGPPPQSLPRRDSVEARRPSSQTPRVPSSDRDSYSTSPFRSSTVVDWCSPGSRRSAESGPNRNHTTAARAATPAPIVARLMRGESHRVTAGPRSRPFPCGRTLQARTSLPRGPEPSGTSRPSSRARCRKIRGALVEPCGEQLDAIVVAFDVVESAVHPPASASRPDVRAAAARPSGPRRSSRTTIPPARSRRAADRSPPRIAVLSSG